MTLRRNRNFDTGRADARRILDACSDGCARLSPARGDRRTDGMDFRTDILIYYLDS